MSSASEDTGGSHTQAAQDFQQKQRGVQKEQHVQRPRDERQQNLPEELQRPSLAKELRVGNVCGRGLGQSCGAMGSLEFHEGNV